MTMLTPWSFSFKFDFCSSPGYNHCVECDKEIKMDALFTVVYTTELEESFSIKVLTVTGVAELMGKILDDTVYEVKITLND